MLRPMTHDDAPAVLDLMVLCWEDLDRRFGRPVDPPPADPTPGRIRIRHLISTDPGGAWILERDGRIAGAALALLREDVWGLSLLIVHPDHQSGGLGRELLAAALAYGEGARGGIIMSSDDTRALRAYSRAGFDLRPGIDVHGTVARAPERPAAVRPGRWPDDADAVAAAGRFVRGATHVRDVPAYLDAGRELLVHDAGNAFLVRQEGTVSMIAADSEALAGDLLRAHLADLGTGGGPVAMGYVTAGNDWAVRIALDAGLSLRPGGPVFTRGRLGPMIPYIPSGAYL